MLRTIIIALVVALALTACALERNNPLDPQNNSDIEVPQTVTGLDLAASGQGSVVKFVKVYWDSITEAEGYYLYRALSYNGSYQNLVPTGIPNADSLMYYDSNVYSGNYYYYKVSAYNEAGLEGPVSAPLGILVQ